jgi:hypothetical protein
MSPRSVQVLPGKIIAENRTGENGTSPGTENPGGVVFRAIV